MNEDIIATTKIKLLNVLSDSISKQPNTLAPNITGIDNRKENLAAFFGGIPKYIQIEMVKPDLEIPGIIAIACAIPTRMDDDNTISF